ncbi:unnamed protein product [Owenia fusiformis]|uniref:Uncharacterized protein n=1 Tax=Owenia fusiformis TaxID=6347 RepID=A0A8J1UH66_OWEFU|nr:unnamed protein product [Owenia fusiformis]
MICMQQCYMVEGRLLLAFCYILLHLDLSLQANTTSTTFEPNVTTIEPNVTTIEPNVTTIEPNVTIAITSYNNTSTSNVTGVNTTVPTIVEQGASLSLFGIDSVLIFDIILIICAIIAFLLLVLVSVTCCKWCMAVNVPNNAVHHNVDTVVPQRRQSHQYQEENMCDVFPPGQIMTPHQYEPNRVSNHTEEEPDKHDIRLRTIDQIIKQKNIKDSWMRHYNRKVQWEISVSPDT